MMKTKPSEIEPRWKHWVPLILSLIFTFAMLHTYILPLNMTIHHRDYILQVWDLWLVNESIIHGQSPYFTTLQYYPVGAQLGRHVLSPGYFPVTFLVWFISGGSPFYPIYAYKVVVWLSYSLILYFSYLTLREVGISVWAAVIPAIAYTFGDFYMFHIHRLHIMSGFFIPLTALFLLKLYKKPTTSTLLICAILFGLGFYFTELTLYIYMATVFFVLGMMLWPTERQQLWAKIQGLGLKNLVAGLVVAIVVLSCFAFQWLSSEALPPNPEEASQYSANVAGFFIPTQPTTPLYGSLFSSVNNRITVGIPGFEIFVGFPFLILGGIGIFTLKHRWQRLALLMALLFFVFSLGPTLKIMGWDTHIGLPYALLSALPPFNVGRTPVRFVAMAFFFWMIIAAFGLTWLQNKIVQNFRRGCPIMLLLTALLLGWTTAEAYSPNPLPEPLILPVHLGHLVAGPVINLPLRYHDPWALLPQMFYKQPTATGYVSRNSKAQEDHFKTLQVYYAEALATGSCQRFVEMGFRNIAIWEGVPDDVVTGLRHSPTCPLNIVDFRQRAAP
jgi:hypothetical protein